MLYNRIKTKPHECCDDKFVKFLKDFSQNAILSAYREFKKAIRNSRKPDSPRTKVNKKPSKTNIGQYIKDKRDNYPVSTFGAGSGETEDTTQQD